MYVFLADVQTSKRYLHVPIYVLYFDRYGLTQPSFKLQKFSRASPSGANMTLQF